MAYIPPQYWFVVLLHAPVAKCEGSVDVFSGCSDGTWRSALCLSGHTNPRRLTYEPKERNSKAIRKENTN
jgi:hypothetical protein